MTANFITSQKNIKQLIQYEIQDACPTNDLNCDLKSNRKRSYAILKYVEKKGGNIADTYVIIIYYIQFKIIVVH